MHQYNQFSYSASSSRLRNYSARPSLHFLAAGAAPKEGKEGGERYHLVLIPILTRVPPRNKTWDDSPTVSGTFAPPSASRG